ncbi:substrate-binding domain-containing protein [Anaerotignum sp. MSJ-24]|uniref:substrate-binding domain-containing protein n=1 Tax=Anaerotignum sp. MSJ-24 TaxID=2841521 RepID=UPI001C0FE1F0|nr:substrate-binding domain-containing protein [Anaerotignum sp. MSJ-24]MBU5464592.1 extracellular solute-binding protein [Anaerotignum sp. MSJ-24]
MKKKILAIAMTALMVVGVAACGSSSSSSTTDSNSTDTTADGMTGQISVISREEGSGTRGAFVELMGIVDDSDNDITTIDAEITNSTSVMLTTIAGNKQSIGYVSLGSLSDDVKAVKVDGVEASVDDIKNGSYSVSRPFLVAYKDGQLSELAQDYLKYILSADGQAIISENGYISVSDSAEAYTASGLSGKLVLAGSTSVSPVMEKLADAYKALNPDVTIEIQQTGSGAGITSAIEGVCDFGMSSRELKESEAAELKADQIALDGIAVIVNNENPTDDISSENIKNIYLGEVTNWEDVK